MTFEETLARWTAALKVDDLPAPVRERVEDIFLDAVASAFAGRTQTLLELVEGPARAFGGAGSATVIGGAPAAPATAVLLNAYAITSATLCDVYRPALCHVTPVSLPPLLALAEPHDVSWGELLAAFAAALEVTVRLARGLVPAETRSRGWHSPGVVGPVGAAAGAARLLGLSAREAGNALAHGAAQAAGTFAALGTEAVKFTQARAAASGLLAGLMAAGGLAAAPAWFTHTDGGMAHAYANGGDAAAALDGLGSDWELVQISLRRWPAASSVQSLIDACRSLQGEQVATLELELSPEAYVVSGPRGWDDPLSAQQSARWVAAVTLADGDWWLDGSSADRIRDEDLRRFAERVSVSAADDLPHAALRARATLQDGRVLEFACADAPGDPARPLTRAQIEEKLRRTAPSDVAGALTTFVADRDDDARVAPVIELLAGRAREPVG